MVQVGVWMRRRSIQISVSFSISVSIMYYVMLLVLVLLLVVLLSVICCNTRGVGFSVSIISVDILVVVIFYYWEFGLLIPLFRA